MPANGRRDLIRRLKVNTHCGQGHCIGCYVNRRLPQKIKAVFSEPVDMKLKKDPTRTIERRTSSLIKMADIPDDTVKRVIPHASVPPTLYGLPNIHK